MGFDQNRGDVITVENIRFMADDTLEKAFAAAEPSMVERVVMPYVLPILSV